MKALRLDGRYTWQGEEYPSVTTVLSVIAKPALVQWAARVVADEAVRTAEAGGHLDVKSLMGAPSRVRDNKADVGTIVHSVLEAYAAGERVDPGQVPAAARPYACSLLEWLREVQPEVLLSEATVFHDEPRYAGTLDAVMRIGGGTFLIDIKTGKSVYREATLQLAAYRYADFIGTADGDRMPVPKVDGCQVLHVTPDCADLVPVEAGQDAYEVFLAARKVWGYVNDSP